MARKQTTAAVLTGRRSALRFLKPTDLYAIVGIDREHSGRARTEYYAKRFDMLAQDEQSSVAVGAERGQRLVGFAFARVLDGEFGDNAPVGVLDSIGVSSKSTRLGVATALLARTEAELADRGVRELRTHADWTDQGMTAFLSAAGFRLSPRVVLERPVERFPDDDPSSDEVVVRSMTERDLPAIIRIDRKVTGRDRVAYFTRKAGEVLRESGIRVSLVAELDSQFAGFLMARVDFGGFGLTETTAVLDTIGVDPDYGRRHVGRALLGQLLLNLGSLRVERLLTMANWDHFELLGFLARTGFRHAQRLAFTKTIGCEGSGQG